MKTKIIFVDGPDDSGKTTLIEKLLKANSKLVELKFDKSMNGLLRINSPEHFEIFKALLPHLCREKVYIVDRCYLSNIVYDSIFRNDNAAPSHAFRAWCKENLNSIEIILDRPYIKNKFKDDLISCSKIEFNQVIDAYRALGSYNIIDCPELNDYIIDQITEFMSSE